MPDPELIKSLKEQGFMPVGPEVSTKNVFVKTVSTDTLKEWMKGRKIGELPLELNESPPGVNLSYKLLDGILVANNLTVVPTKSLFQMLQGKKELGSSPLEIERNTPRAEDPLAIVYVYVTHENKLMFDHAAIGKISDNNQEFIVTKVMKNSIEGGESFKDEKTIPLKLSADTIENPEQAKDALGILAQFSATYNTTKSAFIRSQNQQERHGVYGELVDTDGPTSGPNLPTSAKNPQNSRK